MFASKVGLVSVVSLVALLTFACSAPSQPPTAPNSNQPTANAAQQGARSSGEGQRSQVVVAVADKMDVFNPYAFSFGHHYGVWSTIMEPLVRYDFEKGDFVPYLAEKWSVENETTWLFQLRKGVKFHDGSPFTAADVKHSIERMKNDPDSQQQGQLSIVKEVQVVDDHAVRIITDGPSVGLLATLDYRSISSKSTYDKYGREEADRHHPYGTGPYKLKELVPGQRVVLEKSTSYWGNLPADAPDEVVFREVPESEVRVTMLLNGEVQIAKYLTPEQAERVEASTNSRVVATPGLRIMFLAMNPQFKPWDNKLVRQAVAHAINKEAIIQGVLKGRAEALDGPIGPPQYSYSPDAFNVRFPYDPDKAKQLLREAGFPNGLDVELFSPTNQFVKDKESMEAIAAQLSQVGIRTRVQTPEWGTLWSDIQKGKIPFYFMGRGSVVDPSDWLSQYFETGVTPRLGYSNPKLDALLHQERAAFDPEQRKQVLWEAYNTILEDSPMVFLWQYQDLYGVANGIEWQPLPNEHILPFQMHVKS